MRYVWCILIWGYMKTAVLMKMDANYSKNSSLRNIELYRSYYDCTVYTPFCIPHLPSLSYLSMIQNIDNDRWFLGLIVGSSFGNKVRRVGIKNIGILVTLRDLNIDNVLVILPHILKDSECSPPPPNNHTVCLKTCIWVVT